MSNDPAGFFAYNPEEWSHKLCGCFDNVGLCLLTFFAPCWTAGANAEATGENCFLVAFCYAFVPLFGIYFAASARNKIREEKNIGGGFGGDFLVHLCCPLCALIQDSQEIRPAGQCEAMARE